MKSILLLLAAAGVAAISQAQCPFNPVVTGDLLLCPESTGTLTTQSYDAYQWLSRPFVSGGTAQPIPDATGQTLDVDAVSTPVYISVAATFDGCTETSPEVLVDGLAFLPLVVASSGDFDIGNNGELIICQGDSVWLVAQLPYTTNFQWYDDQQPLNGANDDTLLVTAPGKYWLTASPGECPGWTASLGLQISVVWGNSPGCVTAIDDPGMRLPAEVFPNPAADWFRIEVADTAPVSLTLNDVSGRVMMEYEFSGQTILNVQQLPRGVYMLWLRSAGGVFMQKVVLE